MGFAVAFFFSSRPPSAPTTSNQFFCLPVYKFNHTLYEKKKSQKSAFQPQTEIMSFGFFVMKCYALHSVLKSRKKGPQKMMKYLKYFWGQKIHCERGYGGKNRERKKIMQYQMRNLECQIFSINQTDSLISRHFLRQKTFFFCFNQVSSFFLSGEERRNFYLSLRIFRPFLSFPI